MESPEPEPKTVEVIKTKLGHEVIIDGKKTVHFTPDPKLARDRAVASWRKVKESDADTVRIMSANDAAADAAVSDQAYAIPTESRLAVAAKLQQRLNDSRDPALDARIRQAAERHKIELKDKGYGYVDASDRSPDAAARQARAERDAAAAAAGRRTDDWMGQ